MAARPGPVADAEEEEDGDRAFGAPAAPGADTILTRLAASTRITDIDMGIDITATVVMATGATARARAVTRTCTTSLLPLRLLRPR